MFSMGRRIILGLLLLSNLWTTGSVQAAGRCAATHSQSISQSLIWGQGFNFELAEKTLRSQRSFKKIIPMSEYLKSIGKEPSGTSEVYYVEFLNGLRAVWKPDAEMTGPVSEEATYLVARRLKAKSFVPTIVTEIDGRQGSLSVFVETPFDLVKMEGKVRKATLAHVPRKQWFDMDLIHYLLGQWDRHSGNLLLAANHDLAVIDNEGVSQISIWKLGQYPATRIGPMPKADKTGLDVKNKTEFPYEQIQYLDGSDPAAITAFLERYALKPERLPMKEFKKFDNLQLPYFIWRDTLWRYRLSRSMAPISLPVLSIETIQELRSMTEADFRSILNPKIFTDWHIELIMQRRADILEQAGRAEMIP
ncbi:MAG: hypothetical protein ACXWC9_05660 [Pseudobdellovibrionaceae bacterium]